MFFPISQERKKVKEIPVCFYSLLSPKHSTEGTSRVWASLHHLYLSLPLLKYLENTASFKNQMWNKYVLHPPTCQPFMHSWTQVKTKMFWCCACTFSLTHCLLLSSWMFGVQQEEFWRAWMDRSCKQGSMRPAGFVLQHRIAGRPQPSSLPPELHPMQDINAALGHLIILLLGGPFTLPGTILRCYPKSRIKWNIRRNLTIGFASQRHRMHSHHSTRLKACLGNNSHTAKGIL